MWPVVDRNIVMWRMTVSFRIKPECDASYVKHTVLYGSSIIKYVSVCMKSSSFMRSL